MSRKPKMGRPRRSATARKPSSMVGVRLTRDEKARFSARANDRKMSLSEWIRQAAETFANLTEVSFDETIDASNESA